MGLRGFTDAVSGKLADADLRDLLSVALLFSPTGECASVFAAEPVLVLSFFVVTIALCALACKAEA